MCRRNGIDPVIYGRTVILSSLVAGLFTAFYTNRVRAFLSPKLAF